MREAKKIFAVRGRDEKIAGDAAAASNANGKREAGEGSVGIGSIAE